MPKFKDGTDAVLPSMDWAEGVMMDGNVEGWCLRCGETAYGVEPDARGYECESCGRKAVYGAEELVLRGWIE